MNVDNFLKAIKWNADNLVCVLAVDSQSKEVLMQGWANAESLRLSLESGKMSYFSRSRQKLWVKGEQSGHFQLIKNLKIDCDGDCILAEIEQIGSACHTGHRTCFYRQFKGEDWQEIEKPLKDEREIYG